MENYKIDILGSQWTVVLCDEIKEEGNDNMVFGLCDYENQIISVATKTRDGRNLSCADIRTTFYHELLHAILGEGQYSKEKKNESMIEWIARCMSNAHFNISNIFLNTH